MKKIFYPILSILLLLILGLPACKKEGINSGLNLQARKVQPFENGFAGNDMVMYWNDKFNTTLGAPMIQPARARLYAIMQIAVHDALNSIKPKYKRYALTNEREQFASPDAAVAAAAYWVIKGMNQQGAFPVDSWYAESLALVPEGEAKEIGKNLGKKAADAIIAKRTNDGFSSVIPASPNPPNGTTPGAYRQTNPIGLRIIPNWGEVVQPFALQSNIQFRPGGPYEVSSPEYAVDYNEIKAKGGRLNSTRNSDEIDIARFWSENRPSILWNNFARAVVANKKMDAWKTARFFAIMHTAMADGITSALNANYYFYTWRPETAIREGASDNNGATMVDPGWIPFLNETPLFVSPPLPEYPSGFALYGGAVLGTMLSFFDENSPFGMSDLDISINLMNTSTGTSRRYTSVLQAAIDNSNGKIYAGWQFRKSVVDGQEMGKKIAEYVYANHFTEE